MLLPPHDRTIADESVRLADSTWIKTPVQEEVFTLVRVCVTQRSADNLPASPRSSNGQVDLCYLGGLMFIAVRD